MNPTESEAKVFAEVIATRVAELHGTGGRKGWSAAAGQYLVYGLERYFGFGRCVELEAQVERCWLATPGDAAAKQRAISEVIKDLVHSWLVEKEIAEDDQ